MQKGIYFNNSVTTYLIYKNHRIVILIVGWEQNNPNIKHFISGWF
jgi:hypothetical protein